MRTPLVVQIYIRIPNYLILSDGIFFTNRELPLILIQKFTTIKLINAKITLNCAIYRMGFGRGVQQLHPSSQNSCGHSPFFSQHASWEGIFSKRLWIISSTSEILTLKTSARISLAVWSFKAVGFTREVQCSTALFCGLISCSRTPDIVQLILHVRISTLAGKQYQ